MALLSFLLLNSNSSRFSDMLCRNLLSDVFLIVVELCETSLIDNLDFLFATVLSNFLVEVSKPETDSRLVSDTFLIDAFVILSSLVFLDLLKGTEHRCIHFKVAHL